MAGAELVTPLLLRLYVAVLSTLKGYGDQLWVEVVPSLDSINEHVLAYQAQAKKLPKASPLFQDFRRYPRYKPQLM